MPTFFEEVTSFTDVPRDDSGIDTDKFLDASYSIVRLLNLLDPLKLRMVSSDILGNITKLRECRDAGYQGVQSVSLEKIVLDEKKDREAKKQSGLGKAAESLLWLTRGLAFVCKALKEVRDNNTLALSDAFKKAYEVTLAPKHGWLVKKSIGLVLGAAPTREHLYTVLTEDRPPENFQSTEAYQKRSPASVDDVNVIVDAWLADLILLQGRITDFFASNGLEKVF